MILMTTTTMTRKNNKVLVTDVYRRKLQTTNLALELAASARSTIFSLQP